MIINYEKQSKVSDEYKNLAGFVIESAFQTRTFRFYHESKVTELRSRSKCLVITRNDFLINKQLLMKRF